MKVFQTGDIVRAIVSSGVKIGTYVGKLAVRATGSFNIKTASQLVRESAIVSVPCFIGVVAMSTLERMLSLRAAFLYCH